jgi:hypothetical protein
VNSVFDLLYTDYIFRTPIRNKGKEIRAPLPQFLKVINQTTKLHIMTKQNQLGLEVLKGIGHFFVLESLAGFDCIFTYATAPNAFPIIGASS